MRIKSKLRKSLQLFSNNTSENEVDSFPFQIFSIGLSEEKYMVEALSIFEPDKNSIIVKELSLQDAIKGKYRGTNINIRGSFPLAKLLLTHLHLNCEKCLVKIFATKEAEDYDINKFVEFMCKRIPEESSGISVVKNFPGDSEYIMILCT